MKRLVTSIGVVAVALVAGVSTLHWAVGSGAGIAASRTSLSAIASPGATDISVSVPLLPLPGAALVNQQNSLTAQATITNNGPAADEVVSIETVDVPAGCQGTIGDSLQTVGSDVAVKFGTLPAFNVGDPFNVSRGVAISCQIAGRYDFKYRLEAQPLFGDDANQADNLRAVPFSLCFVPDLTSDFDVDGIPTSDEAAYSTDPCNPDTDADGCLDGREIGAAHNAGGARSPTDPYDFFDVPVPYSRTFTLVGKDRAINGTDVLAVRDGTGHLAGDGFYNPQYDRTPSSDAAQPWRSGPPNGAINGQDLLVVRDSAGDLCK